VLVGLADVGPFVGASVGAAVVGPDLCVRWCDEAGDEDPPPTNTTQKKVRTTPTASSCINKAEKRKSAIAWRVKTKWK
jgi:hypothetical protein